MNFFKNFNVQNNLQAVLYLMGTEILKFRQKLCLWWPFKEYPISGKLFFKCHFSMLFSNPRNFGLEWTFWRFVFCLVYIRCSERRVKSVSTRSCFNWLQETFRKRQKTWNLVKNSSAEHMNYFWRISLSICVSFWHNPLSLKSTQHSPSFVADEGQHSMSEKLYTSPNLFFKISIKLNKRKTLSSTKFKSSVSLINSDLNVQVEAVNEELCEVDIITTESL